MSKIAVVFWSGTGNTEQMANLVAEGAKGKGAEVELLTSAEFTKDMIPNYTGFAFGCPSMGAEVLEETEFQPMWDDVGGALGGKKIVLFGSYGWGDGEWMRNWEEDTPTGVLDTFICAGTPDADAEASCKALGESLV
ncbi:MAG: flavodoxin domain-containing protein [Eubacteriales bacterium]